MNWNHFALARPILRLAVVAALATPACSHGGGRGAIAEGTGGVQGATDGGASGTSEGTGGVHSAPRDGGANGTGRGTGGANPASGSGGSHGTGGSGAMATNDPGGGRDAGKDGAADGAPPPVSSCLDHITDYEGAGPFAFESKSAGAVKFWIPTVPDGCKVPVVHFANGTGAMCDSYSAILERLASHGFLAACYEDPNTSAGTQCITAVETAFMMFPDLADKKVGSLAQGGAAAFTCVQLAEEKWGRSMIYTGFAMQPQSGGGGGPDWMATYAKITSPMLMVSAVSTDGLVSQSWVQQSFDALDDSDEAYFWTVNGLKFIPVPTGEANQVSIAWLRWKLLGDQKACAFFDALPMTDTKWALAASQNAQPCK